MKFLLNECSSNLLVKFSGTSHMLEIIYADINIIAQAQGISVIIISVYTKYRTLYVYKIVHMLSTSSLLPTQLGVCIITKNSYSTGHTELYDMHMLSERELGELSCKAL